jgi:hypothetical protein
MDARRSIVLGPAARTTPTLWSHMRLCQLKAALSINSEANDWVLNNPHSWLGIAFHRLMSALPADSEEAENVWDIAIADILAAASRHPLNSRFANPHRWPSYYLVRQRAIASAVAKHRHSEPQQRGSTEKKTFRPESERLLTARSGRLAGRPDLFDFTTVTEYKSTLPDPDWIEAADIVDGYWRQLRLYAVLIGELGSWPGTARIVAASGQMLEEEVNRDLCEAEADAAILGLERMNRALEGGYDISKLANPGPNSCSQCKYLAICPAFWTWFESKSWPLFRVHAARGTLASVDFGMDGDLYVINLNLLKTQGTDVTQSIALRKSVHGDLTDRLRGSVIRIVFANLRPDGKLRADISTCVFDESDLPELLCRRSQ